MNHRNRSLFFQLFNFYSKRSSSQSHCVCAGQICKCRGQHHIGHFDVLRSHVSHVLWVLLLPKVGFLIVVWLFNTCLFTTTVFFISFNFLPQLVSISLAWEFSARKCCRRDRGAGRDRIDHHFAALHKCKLFVLASGTAAFMITRLLCLCLHAHVYKNAWLTVVLVAHILLCFGTRITDFACDL